MYDSEKVQLCRPLRRQRKRVVPPNLLKSFEYKIRRGKRSKAAAASFRRTKRYRKYPLSPPGVHFLKGASPYYPAMPAMNNNSPRDRSKKIYPALPPGIASWKNPGDKFPGKPSLHWKEHLKQQLESHRDVLERVKNSLIDAQNLEQETRDCRRRLKHISIAKSLALKRIERLEEEVKQCREQTGKETKGSDTNSPLDGTNLKKYNENDNFYYDVVKGKWVEVKTNASSIYENEAYSEASVVTDYHEDWEEDEEDVDETWSAYNEDLWGNDDDDNDDRIKENGEQGEEKNESSDDIDEQNFIPSRSALDWAKCLSFDHDQGYWLDQKHKDEIDEDIDIWSDVGSDPAWSEEEEAEEEIDNVWFDVGNAGVAQDKNVTTTETEWEVVGK